jgi:septum formation protein
MSADYINKRKIILASSSPRRSQLLKESGFWFETVSIDFDETFPDDLHPGLVATHIATAKSRMAAHLIQEDQILLTADSVVVLGDRIFNKPQNEKDAYRMLATLSGKTHQVFTGVCLKDSELEISFSGRSSVSFREFTDSEIRWYIDRYQPYDKAGSYAVQEWIGLCKISNIEGTFANIMGLPTDLVYEGLKHFKNAIRE